VNSTLRGRTSHEELMEAIWVAAEMRAGAAFAHSIIAIAEMEETGSAAAKGQPTPSPAAGVSHSH